MAKPWARFAVGTKSTHPRWVEPDCRPLELISHVTHVSTSARVLEDELLRAGLIFDKSKLNADRILVVWLSPNYWNDGFRYGGLRYTYDFAKLVEGRNAYWVESIAYGIPACRILITDQDRSDLLDEYDPTAGDGPWWLDSDGRHYWNGEYTLEIMFEGDLDVEDAVATDTVKHHAKMCNIDHRRCPERGMSEDAAAGRVLAHVLSRPIDPGLLRWVDEGTDGPEPGTMLIRAFRGFMSLLPIRRPKHFAGAVNAGTPEAAALVVSVAAALDNKSTVSSLMGLFASRDDFRLAVREGVAAAFELDGAEELPER